MKKQIPTYLCYLRLVLVVPFVALFYVHENWQAIAMLIVYVIGAATDWLDGYLARKWKVETAYGAMIDQISDKMFVASVIIVLAAMGNLGGYLVPAAAIILMREIFVSGLREYMGMQKIAMPVSKLGKWKTTSQMVALGLLIIYPVTNQDYPIYEIGAVLLWIAALLSAISAVQYIKASCGK